jgi:hypothetical protein
MQGEGKNGQAKGNHRRDLPEGRVLEVVALPPAGLEAFVPLHHSAVWVVEHIEE